MRPGKKPASRGKNPKAMEIAKKKREAFREKSRESTLESLKRRGILPKENKIKSKAKKALTAVKVSLAEKLAETTILSIKEIRARTGLSQVKANKTVKSVRPQRVNEIIKKLSRTLPLAKRNAIIKSLGTLVRSKEFTNNRELYLLVSEEHGCMFTAIKEIDEILNISSKNAAKENKRKGIIGILPPEEIFQEIKKNTGWIWETTKKNKELFKGISVPQMVDRLLEVLPFSLQNYNPKRGKVTTFLSHDIPNRIKAIRKQITSEWNKDPTSIKKIGTHMVTRKAKTTMGRNIAKNPKKWMAERAFLSIKINRINRDPSIHPRVKQWLKQHYGLEGFYPQGFSEIAHEEKETRQNIHQCIGTVLKRYGFKEKKKKKR